VDRENQRIIKYDNALDRILMVLGTKGEPGSDAKHFNRPTDVAMLSNGDIIVTDGYINNRVAKYAEDGVIKTRMRESCRALASDTRSPAVSRRSPSLPIRNARRARDSDAE